MAAKQIAYGEDARKRSAETIAQPDKIIHRDLPTAIDRRGHVGVLGGGRRIARRDREGHALGQQLGVAQQVTLPGLVESLPDRGVGLDRNGESTGGESGCARADPCCSGRGSGGQVDGRKAQAGVAHDG